MTKQKDFDEFERYFKEYQKRFGLTGYKVYFKHEPLEKQFACINVDQNVMCATVRFNNKLPDKDKPFKNIKRDAKHEALHLLIYRLEALARYRYSTEQEIDETSEELANKLGGLIGD